MDEPYWQGYEAHMGLIEMKRDERGQWTVGERKPAYEAVKAHIAAGTTVAARPRELVIRRRCELKPGPGTETAETRAVIAYAYCLVLGREPDGAGLQGWQARIAGGMSVEELLVELMHSPEFSERYDLPRLTTTESVTLIHRLLFGADPDVTALNSAAAELDAKKPVADVQRAFIGSKKFHAGHPILFAKQAPIAQTAVVREGPQAKPEVRRNCDLSVMRRPLEFERGQVIYSYCLVLGRWPDGLGLQTWGDELRNGLTLERFLLGLLQSNEFAQKYKVEALDDADFVTLAYRVLLGRDPDGIGLESYVSGLAAGALSRTEVYEGVLNSDEFRKKQEALYSALTPERARAELQQTRQ
jgi:hypothetical protein